MTCWETPTAVPHNIVSSIHPSTAASWPLTAIVKTAIEDANNNNIPDAIEEKVEEVKEAPKVKEPKEAPKVEEPKVEPEMMMKIINDVRYWILENNPENSPVYENTKDSDGDSTSGKKVGELRDGELFLDNAEEPKEKHCYYKKA